MYQAGRSSAQQVCTRQRGRQTRPALAEWATLETREGCKEVQREREWKGGRGGRVCKSMRLDRPKKGEHAALPNKNLSDVLCSGNPADGQGGEMDKPWSHSALLRALYRARILTGTVQFVSMASASSSAASLATSLSSSSSSSSLSLPSACSFRRSSTAALANSSRPGVP